MSELHFHKVKALGGKLFNFSEYSSWESLLILDMELLFIFTLKYYHKSNYRLKGPWAWVSELLNNGTWYLVCEQECQGKICWLLNVEICRKKPPRQHNQRGIWKRKWYEFPGIPPPYKICLCVKKKKKKYKSGILPWNQKSSKSEEETMTG